MARIACILVAAAAMFFAGCGQPAPGPVVLDAGDAKPSVDYSDLADVLKKAVTDNGLLADEALKEASARLDAQLRRMIVTGPTVTPGLLPARADRTAYWHNARVAWAMKLALLCDCPESAKSSELRKRAFPIDARMMTLDEIDAELEAEGGWRSVVAGGGLCLQRARLPAVPFAVDDAERRIGERISEFVDDRSRFVIDVQGRRILVPPVLWRYRRELIAAYHKRYETQGATFTTALLPHVSGSALRRLQDAIGYRAVSARSEGKPAFRQRP